MASNPFEGLFDKTGEAHVNKPFQKPRQMAAEAGFVSPKKTVASGADPFTGLFEQRQEAPPESAPPAQERAKPRETVIGPAPSKVGPTKAALAEAQAAEREDSLLKKAARFVLPKSLEEKFGLTKKEPTIKDDLQAIESDRQAVLREKRTRERMAAAGVTEERLQFPSRFIPEGYEEPTGFLGNLKEGIVEGYYNTIRPAAGFLAESVGREIGNPDLIKWGEESADKAIAHVLLHPELLPAEDIQPLLQGGLADKRAWGRTIGNVVPFIASVVGVSTAAGLATRGNPVAIKSASFGTIYAIERASAYRSMLERGIAPDKADTASNVYGVVAAVLEEALGVIPSKFGISLTGTTQRAVSGSFKDFLVKTLPRYSLSFLRKIGEEGAEEGAQQLAQNLVTKWLDTSQPVWENVAESVAQGAVGSLGFLPVDVISQRRAGGGAGEREEAPAGAPTHPAAPPAPPGAPPAAFEGLSVSEAASQLREAQAAAQDAEGVFRDEALARVAQLQDVLMAEIEAAKQTVLTVADETDGRQLANIEVVKLDDGKWAVSVDGRLEDTSFVLNFDVNQTADSKEGAFQLGKTFLQDWMDQARSTLTPADQARLQRIEAVLKAQAKPQTRDEAIQGLLPPRARVKNAPFTKEEAAKLTEAVKGVQEAVRAEPDRSFADILTERGITRTSDIETLATFARRKKNLALANAFTKLLGEDQDLFTATGRELGLTETNIEKVKKAVSEEAKTARQVADETGVLEPSVRRILGEGAKEGTFERVDKGVYVLRTKDGKELAYIQAGDAREVLSKMAADGERKFDMVFLDIPYKTAGVTGGNRGIDFDTISPDEFAKDIVEPVKKMMRTEDAPVVYMFSNSKTGLKDMQRYTGKLIQAGLQIVARGEYNKTYKSGEPMKFGKYLMPPEGILVLNQSGKNVTDLPDTFDFKFIAPLYKGHYQTEKPAELLEAIIKGTTKVGDTVLDPFAGSGVTPAEAVRAGRKAVAVEKEEEVVKKRIAPRVEEAAKVAPSFENLKPGDKITVQRGSKKEAVTVTAAPKEGLVLVTASNFGTFYAKPEEVVSIDEVKKTKAKKQPRFAKKKEAPKPAAPAATRAEAQAKTAPTIREAGSNRLVVPTEKSVFLGGPGTIEATVPVEGEEKRVVTNKFFLEVTDEVPAAEKVTAEAGLKAFQDVISDALAGAKDLLSTPTHFVSVEAGPALQFVNDGKPITVNGRYYNYFAGKYDAQFYGSSGKNPVVVKEDGKLVGIIMPISVDTLGQPLTTTKAEPSEQPATEQVLTPGPTGGSSAASSGFYVPPSQGRPASLERVNPVEVPELLDMVRELGSDVNVKKLRGSIAGMFRGNPGAPIIELTPGLFEDIRAAASTLAHELGHFIDWLPDQTLKRGSLLNRMASLRQGMKETFGDKTIKNSTVRNELKDLTRWWKPFNENTNPSFTAYRFSGRELYADALSVLLNSPGDLQERAPTFFKLFFEYLDRKPEVKETYFAVQEMLSQGRPAVVEKRRESVRGMFDRSDYKAIELERVRQEQDRERRSLKSLWSWFKFEVLSINAPFEDKVREVEKKGGKLNDDENPIFYLNERNYVGSKIKESVERNFQPVFDQLEANGLSKTDLREILFYERILNGDRGKIANPKGLSPEAVAELMGDSLDKDATGEAEVNEKSLRAELGETRYTVLKDLAQRFRDGIKAIFEEGYAEGIYGDELMELVRTNNFYVPFKTQKYMDQRTRYSVSRQVGTLLDIEDPIATTIDKMAAIVRAIERNKASRTSIKFLQSNYADEIEPAKTRWVGTRREIVELEKQDRQRGTVVYLEGGKPQGFYVDGYIAKSLKNDTVAMNKSVIGILQLLNSKWFKPVFIGFNLGFQAFNVFRDFQRFWKNVPGMTMLKAFGLYRKAWKDAVARGFDNNSALVSEMERSGVLGLTYNDILADASEEDRQVDLVLRRYGLGEKPSRFRSNALVKMAMKVLDQISALGNTLESLPKVAAYIHFRGDEAGPKLDNETRDFIRRFVGSPDFLARGEWTRNINAVFLFSNAIAQGIRADFEIARYGAFGNPKYRSGWWWKTAKVNVLPKVLMYAGLAGVFGQLVQEVMKEATEYDKTNYVIVPIGKDANKKAVYLRMPQDETGRFIGAAFWKSLQFASTGEAKQLQDIAGLFGGQIPAVTPAITLPIDIFKFLTGQNVYDSFRQRTVLTETEMAAGGKYALKPILTYIWNEAGGNVFLKLFSGEPTEPRTGLEKVLRLPILSNVIGRFLKVTDYGTKETTAKVSGEVRSDRARRTIDDRKVVNKYVQEAVRRGLGRISARELERDMITEVIGHYPLKTKEEAARASALRTKFRSARLKGVGDIYVDSVVDAQSNEEKVELLKRYRDEMPDDKFKTMVNFLLEEKAVSPYVIGQLRK